MNRLIGVAAIAGLCVAAASPASSADLTGEAGRGQALYQACAASQSLDENDLGPRHRGVVGRRAGSVADYAYSPALKSSGLTWDAATLDRWLTNPSALVPGTKMFFQVAEAQNRADIIAFLKEQR
jgi:cytochrome c